MFADPDEAGARCAEARRVAERYLDYPVLHWRQLFTELTRQLAELDAEEPGTAPQASASLACELQGRELSIDACRCGELVVRLFRIDLEMLFSRQPFLAQAKVEAGVVKPVLEARLPAGCRLTGPAIIEEYSATTLLGPGDEATVGALGEIAIRVALATEAGP